MDGIDMDGIDKVSTALLNRLGSGGNPEATDGSAGASDQTTAVASTKSAPAQQEPEGAKTAEPLPAVQGHPHKIPYDRFQEVVGARDRYKAEAAQLSAKLDQLEAEMAQLRRAQARGDTSVETDEQLEDDEAEAGMVLGKLNERLTALEHDREVDRSVPLVEREVAEALRKFPQIAPEHVYAALVDHPELSAEEVAEQLDLYRESVIARWTEQQPRNDKGAATTKAPTATTSLPPPPPVPQPSPSGTIAQEREPARNVDEVTERLRARMQRQFYGG